MNISSKIFFSNTHKQKNKYKHKYKNEYKYFFLFEPTNISYSLFK